MTKPPLLFCISSGERGCREQLAFPEIDYDKVDRLRGLEISIVTTAKNDEESRRLLELLGMPFAG